MTQMEKRVVRLEACFGSDRMHRPIVVFQHPDKSGPAREEALAAARKQAEANGKMLFIIDYVTPEDVKSVAYDILRHRILLTYEAEAENISSEQVVSKILDRIEVP